MGLDNTGVNNLNAEPGIIPVSDTITPDAMVPAPLNKQKYILLFLGGAIGLVGLYILLRYLMPEQVLLGQAFVIRNLTPDFFLYVLGGFLAQMVDGALGMAYGLTSTTFLLSFGISPAAASASVHTSEIFTSGASGLMHLKLKNVNKKLFQTLLIPGVIGAILGAYVLSSLEAYNYILKPAVAIYTLILGALIIKRAFLPKTHKVKSSRIAPLAIFGGFVDSVGGGGWGPVVSSSLIVGGHAPRFAIGSVNLAEFFIALASSITFFTMIGIDYWKIIAGLVIGGVIAAPIAANLSKNLPVKTLMIMVGILVVLVSLRILYMSIYA